MAVEVKRIELWRSEVQNEPGILAGALGPLSEAGTDLEILMAYRFPANHDEAAIEVYPVEGEEAEKAAERAGLSRSKIPALRVKGDDKPGMGHAIAEALAEIGINIAFFVAQVIGDQYAAVIGFDNESDARAAEPVIREVAAQF